MRVISINFDRIHSAFSKKLLPWLVQQEVDIICVQEIEAHLNLSVALFGMSTPLTSNALFEANPPCSQKINKPNYWQEQSTSRDSH